MGLFGGSTSKTSSATSQVGADNAAIVVGNNSSYSKIDNFPEQVASFAQSALTGAFGIAHDAVAGANASQASLGSVAETTKTPLKDWLPIVGTVAVAVVLAFYFRGHK